VIRAIFAVVLFGSAPPPPPAASFCIGMGYTERSKTQQEVRMVDTFGVPQKGIGLEVVQAIFAVVFFGSAHLLPLASFCICMGYTERKKTQREVGLVDTDRI
jgi:hypothetical protein